MTSSHYTKQFLCLSSAVGVCLPAYGALFAPDIASNQSMEWAAGNWAVGGTTQPDNPDLVGNDSAFINDGKTVNVNASVPKVDLINIENINNNGSTVNVNSGGTLATNRLDLSERNASGTLNILTGGSFTVSDRTLVGFRGGSGGGFININGGSFLNDATGSREIIVGRSGNITLNSGSFTATGSSASHTLQFGGGLAGATSGTGAGGTLSININGGTFNAGGGQVLMSSLTTVNVTGSNAMITMDRLSLDTASRAATINFDFDSTGISTIQGNDFLRLSNAGLNIDGTDYAGGSDVFVLFSSTDLQSISSNVTITGFDPGEYTAVLTQDQGGSEDVFLTVTAIPEPSVVSFALAALGFGFIRRRH
ncbi:hypothetical protein [Haloferula sp.]|uniref:hypothetical protein n=1 Tax=Haloferula sp. TaxID=2497595 RepID=UPI003C764110